MKLLRGLFVTAALLCGCLSVFAQIPSLKWARQLTGDDWDGAQNVAIDQQGNVYSSGYFTGTVDFDPGPGVFTMTSIAPGMDKFILKLDSSGNFLWAESLSASSGETITCIAVDGSGDLYVAGAFMGLMDADPGVGTSTIISAGAEAAFISKFSANGAFIWIRKMGGPQADRCLDMTTDNNNNLWIVGDFYGTGDFDPGTGTFSLTSNGLTDNFVMKLTSTGNFLFAKSYGNNGLDVVSSICLDPYQNAYLTGDYSSNCDFDPGQGQFTLTATSNGWNAYLLKLTSTGNFVWAKDIQGTSGSRGMSIRSDYLGNLFLAGLFGSYGNILDFDPGPGTYTVSTNNLWNIYLLRLNNAGNFVWAKTFAATTSAAAGWLYDMTMDAASNLYLSSYLSGTVDLDPGPGSFTVANTGNIDGCLWAMDPNGNFLWGNVFLGTGTQVAVMNDLEISNTGHLHCAGFISGTIDIDPSSLVYTVSATPPNTITASNESDILLLKLRLICFGNPPLDSTSTLMKNICAGQNTTLTAFGNGTIKWYSSPSGTTSLANGNTYVTPPLNAGTSTYYAEANTCQPLTPRIAITVNVTSCTGLEEFDMGQFFVSPNPAKDYITISSLNGMPNAKVLIYDVSGKMVRQENKINESTTRISVSGISVGLYTILLIDENGNCHNKKLVVMAD